MGSRAAAGPGRRALVVHLHVPTLRKRNTLLMLVVVRLDAIGGNGLGHGLYRQRADCRAFARRIGLGRGNLRELGRGHEFLLSLSPATVLELGECVVHDLRKAIFVHLQRMTPSFFHRTKLGSIISRMTSDTEAVRAGVQDVVFTSLVGLGQMLVASALMLWYDPVLFLVVAAMGPVLGWLNYRFRGRLSDAHRAVQESFSRVTVRLVEAVHGVQVTQGFARQQTRRGCFATWWPIIRSITCTRPARRACSCRCWN